MSHLKYKQSFPNLTTLVFCQNINSHDWYFMHRQRWTMYADPLRLHALCESVTLKGKTTTWNIDTKTPLASDGRLSRLISNTVSGCASRWSDKTLITDANENYFNMAPSAASSKFLNPIWVPLLLFYSKLTCWGLILSTKNPTAFKAFQP